MISKASPAARKQLGRRYAAQKETFFSIKVVGIADRLAMLTSLMYLSRGDNEKDEGIYQYCALYMYCVVRPRSYTTCLPLGNVVTLTSVGAYWSTDSKMVSKVSL